jgi:hypothetical protein
MLYGAKEPERNEAHSRRVRSGAIQPIVAVVVIAAGAFLSVRAPRGRVSTSPVLAESDSVSALARATVEWIAADGRVLSSRIIDSIKLGAGADDASQFKARLIPNSYYGPVGQGSGKLVPSRPSSAFARSVRMNPLRFVTDVAVHTDQARGAEVLGPTGRDSLLMLGDGHSSLSVRYGYPGEPDTLREVYRDGRLAEVFHTSWTRVHGGQIMRAEDYEAPFPDGSRLRVRAELRQYAFKAVTGLVTGSTGRSRAMFARSQWCFSTYIVTFPYSGVSFFTICQQGNSEEQAGACAQQQKNCEQADEYYYGWLERYDNCLPYQHLSPPNDSTCGLDSTEVAFYYTLDTAAYNQYYRNGCPAF